MLAKCHYSRAYRVGGLALMVAEPIQDMSAVSVTDKTAGFGLPRLAVRSSRMANRPDKSYGPKLKHLAQHLSSDV
jgi:hypothetical protein